MSSVGRLFARPQERGDEYAFCPDDRYWFRPAYTEGVCPLCGRIVAGGTPATPLLARFDRSWTGVGLLALESLGMIVLVLLMYFKS